MLKIRYGVSALDLFDGNGVLAVPLDKHFLFPWLELQIVIVLHSKFGPNIFVIQSPSLISRADGRIVIAVLILAIAGSHIEISTSKISLILILGFPDIEIYIEGIVVLRTNLKRTGRFDQVLHITQRVVTPGTVGRRVGGVKMITILIGIVLRTSPPGLGKTMLYITTGDCRTGCTEFLPVIAVHIHTITVFILIGIVEHFP